MKAVTAFLLYNSGENVLFYRRCPTKNRPHGQTSPTLHGLPTFGGLSQTGRSLSEFVFHPPFSGQKRGTLFIM
jgi:hypothetical protein